MQLEELAEHLGIPIDDEDVYTLSGLVLDRLGRPPRVGDSFKHKDLIVMVNKVKGRGAHVCTIRLDKSPLREPEKRITR